MAKELPYYQFEVAEYLAGDIMICSLEAQGLYAVMKAIYWQKECKLTLRQLLKRHNRKDLIDELLEENCFTIDEDDFIVIKFLDIQFDAFHAKRQKLSAAGKRGGQRKKKATLKPPLSEVKATPKHLEENRVEEKKIEESIIEDTIEILSEFDFSFFWDLYDKKVGDKEKLKKSYDNLKEETKFKIFKHVEQYKLSQPDKKFRKNPSTYINQKSWNDEIITSTSTKQPTESYTSKLSNW